MNSEDNNQGNVRSYRSLTGRALAKSIHSADVPQEYIRTIPAQSLYLAIKQNGIRSSADLIEMARIEQCRLFTDFDLWQKDSFCEENFWEWLELADEEGGLKTLQKFVKFVDLKLVALVIARHVEIVIFEEPTEKPPAEKFYTPDKGFTWVNVKIEDEHHYFLLSRLLALIFETNAELFYQLISIRNVATTANLEEDSFNEKNKRLAAEGVPEPDYAWQINSALDENLAAAELRKTSKHDPIEDIQAIEPMIYESGIMQPLSSLFAVEKLRESLESELSLIMNAAIMRWTVEFYERDKIFLLAEKVKGAVNLGLEISLKLSQSNPTEVFNTLGLVKIYQLGLGKLFALASKAQKISEETLLEKTHDQTQLAILESLKDPFPSIPVFFGKEDKHDEPVLNLQGGTRAIAHLTEVEEISKFLDDISLNK